MRVARKGAGCLLASLRSQSLIPLERKAILACIPPRLPLSFPMNEIPISNTTRTCPVCGQRFEPQCINAVYDSRRCRATAARRKEAEKVKRADAERMAAL